MTRLSKWLPLRAIVASVGALGVAWASTPQPLPFAPDVISGQTGADCLSFTPDGNTAVVDSERGNQSAIAISHRATRGWSALQIAPFSGRWVDHDPAVAPDGSYLIFTSNRPDVAGGKALHGGHLWRVNRDGRGWSAPIRLPDVVNFGQHIYAPSIAANGDVFFLSKDTPSHDFHIFRAVWDGGHYREAMQLQLGPSGAHELDPAIAPDESFIVFDANYAGKDKPDHLYIAFADGNRWSSPIDLGDTLDRLQPWGSHLGPDGHTLYFTSDAVIESTGSRMPAAGNAAANPAAGGANHIWSVDLSSWLRARPAARVGAPSVFAAGVISGPANDAAATFMPDGKNVYFFRSNGDDYDILSSHFDGASWSEPVIAPFSGHWRDLEPAIAPDGSSLIFASSRPIDGSGKPIDGHWGGQLHEGRGGHLWRVNRKGDGWSAPVLLPDVVNRFDSTFSPAIAADGSLYFMAATGPGGHFQLYYSQFRDGRYRTPELLPFTAGQYGGVDPAIAPDQSFIVFGSNRPPTPERDSYAFIAFRSHGHWGNPIPLPPAVNSLGGIDELRLGPDGHTLYVTSNHVVAPEYPKTTRSSVAGLQQMQSWNDGQDNIWMFDLAPWLEQRPTTPQIFAPGVISGPLDDASPAFMPDGKTVYFVRGDQSSTLMESHLEDGTWSAPQPASFSGRWRDLDPAMAPDGSYLLFVSNRPVTPDGKPLDLVFGGKVYPTGMNIWRVDRQGDGWSKPVRLPSFINTSAFTFAPSIAADNTLYYVGQTSPGQRRLLRARYRDGHYLQPEIVPVGDPNDWIRDPAIAPDQSFVVFSIIPAGSKRNPRLAIAFRQGGGWSRPIDLGDSVNGGSHAMGSQLGPDHHTLYFYSDRKLPDSGAERWNDGRDNIWTIDLAPWLGRAARPSP